MEVKADSLECPGGGTRTACVTRPYILVYDHKGNEAVLREEGEKFANIFEVFHVVNATEMGQWE